MLALPCAWCGAVFNAKPYAVRVRGKKFCSRSCQGSAGNAVRPRKPLADRFASKLAKGEGCWLWTGSRNNHGYGQIADEQGRDGRLLLAHRVAWELANGRTLTSEEEILHACDTPACVNPDHLRVGSHAENMADMAAKGRSCKGRSLRVETRELRS
jgi:hypothetical protein